MGKSTAIDTGDKRSRALLRLPKASKVIMRPLTLPTQAGIFRENLQTVCQKKNKMFFINIICLAKNLPSFLSLSPPSKKIEPVVTPKAELQIETA